MSWLQFYYLYKDILLLKFFHGTLDTTFVSTISSEAMTLIDAGVTVLMSPLVKENEDVTERLVF